MEENMVETNREVVHSTYTKNKILKFSAVISIAVAVGFMHYKYVSQLFENDRNFSYLSEMEREMSFRTEMGFYYSYYKTVIEEKPFLVGISNLVYDKLVEFPHVVNAFNRFNIHPEVIIGAMYRYIEPYINTPTLRQCHVVDRGPDLPPVESCVGIGQPVFFYLEVIWVLAGLNLATLFLHANTLSESMLGGVVSVAQYLANHSECTRVQWAPNERENLAAPLLLLQTWLVSQQLRNRNRKATFPLQLAILTLNCLCLLFWQFSQFILLTQTAIFFVMEQLKIIDIKALCIFLHSHFWGLHLSVLLLQGNDMLKSSLYTSFFLVVSLYSLFYSVCRIKVQNGKDLIAESWLIVLRILFAIVASFFLKKVISEFLQVDEDSHIWDILYSKFTDYRSFHTLLYTCSDVFDFLPWSTVEKLIRTLLIPLVILSVLIVCNYWLSNAVKEYRDEKETEDTTERDSTIDDEDSGIENNSDNKTQDSKSTHTNATDLDVLVKNVNCEVDAQVCEKGVVLEFLSHVRIDAAIFYNISQMIVYGFMAALVMRLKLLFVTQMCVVSSLVMNIKYYILPKWSMKLIPVIWVISMVSLARDIAHNMAQEMAHVGEFSDVPQEELLEWIKAETSVGGAFAGSMPILATVMLTTRRPIVAHPHYEHLEARQRAYSVYKVYGRFPPKELYDELTKLRASYLIVETKYCYGRSSKGCSLEEIWDVEFPSARGPKLCHTLLTQPVDHFYPLFKNDHYAVYKLHDFSVRYMPRSFDT